MTSTGRKGGVTETPVLSRRPRSPERSIRRCTEGEQWVLFECCTPREVPATRDRPPCILLCIVTPCQKSSSCSLVPSYTREEDKQLPYISNQKWWNISHTYGTVSNVYICFVHQAFVGLDRGESCFENPVFPSDNGLKLLDYTDGCLTFEGEINKLATNVAIGRCGARAGEKWG